MMQWIILLLVVFFSDLVQHSHANDLEDIQIYYDDKNHPLPPMAPSEDSGPTVRMPSFGFGPLPCSCQILICSCCVHVKIKFIQFDPRVCIKVTYLPPTLGVNIGVTFNGTSVFKMDFSVRHICTPQHFGVRTLATAEAIAAAPKVAVRAPSDNPVNHTVDDIAKIYTIPDDLVNKLFSFRGVPTEFTKNAKTFGEHNIQIRSPAIEIIDYMKKTDYNKPVIRYMLYGKPGSGKSMTIAHIIHFAHTRGFVIVHVPWVWDWFGHTREVVTSTEDPTLIELPLDAALWLKRFDLVNSDLLTQLDLRVTKDYVWSKREQTPKDSPLPELVKFGINRVKYAPACVDALINELKHHSRQGRCKTLVAIDGYNGFFAPSTRFKTDEKIMMVPLNVTLTKTFVSAVQADWNNGAVVVTVDRRSGRNRKFLINHTDQPVTLLGKKGTESIDPFIPVLVPNLTDVEFHNLLDYYEEKRWLQTPNAREELEFISQRNPYDLVKLCASL